MATPTWINVFASLSGTQPASTLDQNFDQATQVTTMQTPLAPVAGGVIGTDGYCARSDHQHPPQGATPTVISGTTYSLAPADDGGVLEFTSGSAIVLTIPTGLAVGFSCLICQAGGGQITLTPSGTTLHNASGNTKTRAQWSELSLRCRATNDYVASGDMAS